MSSNGYFLGGATSKCDAVYRRIYVWRFGGSNVVMTRVRSPFLCGKE